MGLTILIVDDDDVLLHLHRTVVKRSGFSSLPVCFKDGIPAIEYLKEQPMTGEGYLILLDINMPLMDGWQFLEALQTFSNTEFIWVVMASSSVSQLEKDRAMQYKQVIDHIEKPITIEVFKKIMELPLIAAQLN